MIGRKYANPPVVEAVCEFHFEPSGPWDLTIPGLVYEQVRQEFPKRKRLTRAIEASIATSVEGVEQQVLTTDRMQFLREDEKALIQVDQDFLAVNHLKPYPTWEKFRPLIEKGFRAYRDVASPKGIRRVGLRYINRIEIPGRRIELEDYLEFRPFVGSRLPQDHGPFIVGIQIPYENERDILTLQLASAPPDRPDTVAAILDLHYFQVQPGRVALDSVFQWIEVAHTHIEEVFEACITDRLREMFGESSGE